MGQVSVFDDVDALSEAAASFFVSASHRALEREGRFSVCLSGGSAPQHLYRILASEKFWRAVPWDRTFFFWGDERAVGPDHEYSNFRVADELLLSRVPVPKQNIFRIKGELGAEIAAEDLRRDLINHFGDREVPRFDLAFLGLGPDGHVASLFPDSPALDAAGDWTVAVAESPTEPHVERVSMTLPVFNAARHVRFLAAGAGKADVVHDALSGGNIPAAQVTGEDVGWLIDKPAAAKLG